MNSENREAEREHPEAAGFFTSDQIRENLHTRIIGRSLFCLSHVDSTNRLARELAAEGAEEGTLVVADSQDRGRGRLGRSWFSPSGCNLYLSLILRPALSPSRVAQVTLMTAVSLCETLIHQTGLPVRIKWPNDLYIRGKKLGGILSEGVLHRDRIRFLVVGIGINVNLKEEDFRGELGRTGTSLLVEGGRRLDRSDLLRSVLVSLDSDYDRFRREGFTSFRRRWAQLSMTLGERVRVRLADREVTGTALGLGGEGGLRVREKDGTVINIESGDVIQACSGTGLSSV